MKKLLQENRNKNKLGNLLHSENLKESVDLTEYLTESKKIAKMMTPSVILSGIYGVLAGNADIPLELAMAPPLIFGFFNGLTKPKLEELNLSKRGSWIYSIPITTAVYTASYTVTKALDYVLEGGM